MSPTVSTRRRSEPASLARHAGLVCHARPRGSSPASPSARSSRISVLRGPAPASIASRICCSLRSAMPACPRSVPARSGGLELGERRRSRARRRCGGPSSRPTPGSRLISTRLSGSFARSFSSDDERAGLAQLLDLRGDRVADAVELGQPALLGEPPDRLVRLAHAGGSPAIGEHPVDDCAVELVQVAEQVDDLGDLAVGERHSMHDHR